MNQQPTHHSLDERTEETARQIMFTAQPGATSDPLPAVKGLLGRDLDEAQELLAQRQQAEEERAQMNQASGARRERPMSQERLAHLIHEQTAAIAALERRIGTHATIQRILRALALEELTTAQAIGILAETAERSTDSAQQALYQQTIAALRQMPAKVP